MKSNGENWEGRILRYGSEQKGLKSNDILRNKLYTEVSAI